jgi:hypothetical protein
MTATRRDRKGRAPRDAERWTRAIPVDTVRTGWYAFMRAHRMRRMRLPPPRVDPGDPVP